MLGTLIAGGLSAGLGAFLSSRQAKKRKKMLNNAWDDNNRYFLENLYLNDKIKNAPLQRIEAQTDKARQAITGGAIQTGATNENKLAAMEKANEIYAQANSDLTNSQIRNEMNIREDYKNRQDDINNQRSAIRGQRAANFMNLGQNLAGSLIDYGLAKDYFKAKPEQVNHLNYFNGKFSGLSKFDNGINNYLRGKNKFSFNY